MITATMTATSGAMDLLKEFLDSHALPSVIVGLFKTDDGNLERASIVYANPSFTNWIGVSLRSEESFKTWAQDISDKTSIWQGLEKGKSTCHFYGRRAWAASCIQSRWGLIQSQYRYEEPATPKSEIVPNPRKRARTETDEETLLLSTRAVTPSCEMQSWLQSQVALAGSLTDRDPVVLLDWSRNPIIPHETPFMEWLRAFDWSRTKIGPVSNWGPVVRHEMLSIIANPAPRAIYFGLENPVMLYNEACAELLGHRHPEAMGAMGSVGAGPYWATKYEGIKKVWETGEREVYHDWPHPIPRDGVPWAEAHFCWSVTPIPDDCGRMVGVKKEFWESTLKVITERGQETIAAAERMISFGDSMSSYWTKLRDIIESNQQDFPFCLIYSVPQASQSNNIGATAAEDVVPKVVTLEGLVGLESNHAMAIEHIDLTGRDSPLVKFFRSSWIRMDYVSLSNKDHTLPASLCATYGERGWSSKCTNALLCPIRRLGGPGAVGFVLFGLNPLRIYDQHYEAFIKQLMDKLAKAAAAILVPEEHEKLKQQWQKALDEERSFTRLAEFASVGLATYEPNLTLRYKNPTFAFLTNAQEGEAPRHQHRLPIHPDDNAKFERTFTQLATSTYPHRNPYVHFRVQTDLSIPVEHAVEDANQWRWLSAHASGEYDLIPEDTCNLTTVELATKRSAGEQVALRNVLRRIAISVLDITPQQQEIHDKGERLAHALETKRQSENFIDMTCHEMRNPLSAIIQSADGILSSLDPKLLGVENLSGSNTKLDAVELQTTTVESAQTILLCAQHQKRIVDDILTLSKLESHMLRIAPDRVQPMTLVERAMSMYEGELADAGISASFVVNNSYCDLEVDHVYLDPARLLQILINLLTNAIKFTRTQPTKRITVVLGASLSVPTSGAASSSSVNFFPQHSRVGNLSDPEWGNGEIIHLQFDVCDTGKGLTGEEMGRLFQRFQQASARTFSQYGGSGLGLFISRELTELQGGQIGVDSIPGQGTTFAFYIKARRSVPEPTEVSLDQVHARAGLMPQLQPLQKSLAGSFAYADAVMPDAKALDDREQYVAKRVRSAQTPSDLHILLVEDNLINQRVTAQQLRKVGCTVHVANHGLECLAFLEKSDYRRTTPTITVDDRELPDYGLDNFQVPVSVILLDQEMPVMDGLECIRRIRAMQQEGTLAGHVPVIACTGSARQEQAASFLKAGMDEVVTKPFRINELLPKMYELIKKIRDRDSQNFSIESSWSKTSSDTGMLESTGVSGQSSASAGIVGSSSGSESSETSVQ